MYDRRTDLPSQLQPTQSNLTRLFVNDIEVFVPPNTTVLEACEKVGVQVSASARAHE